MTERSPSSDEQNGATDDEATWPPVVCPLWCTGGHRASDHPEDHIHRSRAVVVPAKLRENFLTNEIESVELLVYASLEDGSTTAWCSIAASEDPEPHLNLSMESADLLRQALTRVLPLR